MSAVAPDTSVSLSAPEGTWLVIASVQWSYIPTGSPLEVIQLPATCWLDGVTNGPITLFEGGLVLTSTWGTETASALAPSGEITLDCNAVGDASISNLTLSIQRVSD